MATGVWTLTRLWVVAMIRISAVSVALIGASTALAETCFQRSDLANGLVFETPVVVSDKTLMNVVQLRPNGTALRATYRNYRPNRPAFIARSWGGVFTFESWYANDPEGVNVTSYASVPTLSDLGVVGDSVSSSATWTLRNQEFSFAAERITEVIEARQADIDGCTYDTLFIRTVSDVERSDGQQSQTSFSMILVPELMWEAFIPLYEDLAIVTIRRAMAEDLRFFEGVQ